MQNDRPPHLAHSRFEDGYAFFVGCVLIVLGFVLLRAGGLVTGGVAGLALLASYLVPLPVGLLFALINIPFFLLAGRLMGGRFMAKTMVVNLGITLFSALAPAMIGIGHIHPAVAALAGGTAIGMGMLAIARHGAGVGGSGVVALWLMKRNGWNAGRTQIAIDAVILALSLTVVSPLRLGWSALSAIAINGVVLVWHRPERYTGY